MKRVLRRLPPCQEMTSNQSAPSAADAGLRAMLTLTSWSTPAWSYWSTVVRGSPAGDVVRCACTGIVVRVNGTASRATKAAAARSKTDSLNPVRS